MTAADPTPGQPAPVVVRVPVWGVIAAGLRSVFLYPANLARRTWPLVLVTVGVMTVLGARFIDLEQAAGDSPGAGLGIAVVALTALAVAVRWHRGLLTGEAPPGIAVLRPEIAWLRFALAFVLMVAGTLTAASLVIAVLFGLVLAVTDPDRAYTAMFGLALPVVVAMIAVTGRLIVAYPMIALGGKTVASLRQSWRLTRGNTWRLLLLTAIYTLLEWVLFPGVYWLFHESEKVLGAAGFALGVLADAALTTVFTALIASILSYIYAVLTGHPAASAVARRR